MVRIHGLSTAKPVVGCKILFWGTNHDTGARRAPYLLPIAELSLVSATRLNSEFQDLSFAQISPPPSPASGFP